MKRRYNSTVYKRGVIWCPCSSLTFRFAFCCILLLHVDVLRRLARLRPCALWLWAYSNNNDSEHGHRQQLRWRAAGCAFARSDHQVVPHGHVTPGTPAFFRERTVVRTQLSVASVVFAAPLADDCNNRFRVGNVRRLLVVLGGGTRISCPSTIGTVLAPGHDKIKPCHLD